MKRLKNIILKLIRWFIVTIVSLRIFLKWPIFCVSLACIPLNGYLQKVFKLTPVLSKVLAVAIFGLLLWLSFHVGELAVILCAVALIQEANLIHSKIKDRLQKDTTVLC